MLRGSEASESGPGPLRGTVLSLAPHKHTSRLKRLPLGDGACVAWSVAECRGSQPTYPLRGTVLSLALHKHSFCLKRLPLGDGL